MKKIPLALAATVLAASAAVLPMSGSNAAPSYPSCAKMAHKTHITTTRGAAVWVPSSLSAGVFQFGGQQSLSISDGVEKGKTSGSANTVGGEGGVNVAVYSASLSYNHQWNKSTTTSASLNQTFTTTSPTMPNKVNWRWRLYMRGYRFTVTKKVVAAYPGVEGCYDAYIKRRVIVPNKRPTFTFHVETYAHRNWLLNSSGTPIRRWG